MLDYLNNKRILFFGLGFFEYDRILISELESNGAHVDYINTSYISFFQKLKVKITRLEKTVEKSRKKNIVKYLKKYEQCQYDIIFAIDASAFTSDYVHILKELFSGARFVLYMWDTLKRCPQTVPLLKIFDKVFSFDYDDCKRYDCIEYRPLFCKKFSNNADKDIDVLFVGGIHSDRLQIIQNLYNFCLSNGLKCSFNILISKGSYYKKCFSKKIDKKFLKNCFVTKPIPSEVYFSLLERAKSIIDIHHPDQSGLTMRTIEALGNNCFIFTTNENIKQEGLPTSCFEIIDRNVKELNSNILKNVRNVDTDKYSVPSFLDSIFSEVV